MTNGLARARRGSSGRRPVGPLRRSRSALVLVAGAVAGLVMVLSAPPAGAHPLGNFTVNRYARIEISAGKVRVYYVLDEAELPAFAERQAVSAGPARFARRRLEEIAGNLQLRVDGRRLPLRVVDQSLDQPPGQAGLKTLRVAAVYVADLPSGGTDRSRDLEFADGNGPDRIGWREIVTVARGDARIERSTAPQRDVSDELRHYPGDLIQAPLDLRSVRATFTPGTEAVAALAVPRSAPPPSRTGGAFANLISRQHVSPLALIGTLLLAFGFGASHALLPGHGKTVMAAYLVGTKGRPIDAVLLGVIVSIMHTFSVIVLGLVLFRLSHDVQVEKIYPQLTLASGAMAVAFGVWLLSVRLRSMRRTDAARAALRGHNHDHDHDHLDAGAAAVLGEPMLAHAAAGPATAAVEGPASVATGHAHHDHAQPAPSHDVHAHHEPGHHHHHGPGGHTHELPEDIAPLSRRGLVVLATSGGIVPSPSAVIVVVAAFSLGRIALGLTLIAAFSVGLAVTLTAVGLALVFGRSAFERRFPDRSLRYLPLAGACALIVAGAVLAMQGLTSIG